MSKRNLYHHNRQQSEEPFRFLYVNMLRLAFIDVEEQGAYKDQAELWLRNYAGDWGELVGYNKLYLERLIGLKLQELEMNRSQSKKVSRTNGEKMVVSLNLSKGIVNQIKQIARDQGVNYSHFGELIFNCMLERHMDELHELTEAT